MNADLLWPDYSGPHDLGVRRGDAVGLTSSP